MSGSERQPTVYEKSGTIAARASVEASVSVERGLNDIRLAVLGIVVTIGLTVGIGFQATWWVGVVAGLGSLLFACFLIRYARQPLMSVMHWLTGS
jgi:hypothetical protein